MRRIPDQYPFRKLQATIRTTLTERQINKNIKGMKYPQYSTAPVTAEEAKLYQDPTSNYRENTKTDRELDLKRILMQLP